jgi:citrate lyase beta subunit
MCEKAAASGADLVFLDLEDACAPVAKEGARRTAVAALTGLDWGRTLRAVRVNGLETPWCHGDVIEVVAGARDALDVLIVPKARTARDVWWFDVLLTQLEAKLGLGRRIALEVLIEDAEGLANAVEIARASERLEALIFGAGDLSASLRARVDGNFDPVGEYPGDFWHFARAQVVTAARSAGIDAIDAPFPAASTASGRSTPRRSRSPTRCSPRRPRRSRTPGPPSRRTGPPRPGAWAPSGATAGSWTPPTCGSPRTSSTRRRSPRARGAGDDAPRRAVGDREHRHLRPAQRHRAPAARPRRRVRLHAGQGGA